MLSTVNARCCLAFHRLQCVNHLHSASLMLFFKEKPSVFFCLQRFIFHTCTSVHCLSEVSLEVMHCFVNKNKGIKSSSFLTSVVKESILKDSIHLLVTNYLLDVQLYIPPIHLLTITSKKHTTIGFY